MTRILIAEDDYDIASLERDYLEMEGYQVDIINDGALVEGQLEAQSYDLLLLDVMLPNQTGYELCRRLRDSLAIPILMVTAKQDTADIVRGLGLGADDYITKPFDPMILLARVKSHLARYQRLRPVEAEEIAFIKQGELEIYPDNWQVFLKGQEIKLANREFELLVYLAKNKGRVLSKDQLFEKIWGYDYLGDSATVTVHINRLRDKLGPDIIETVWGAGYRFKAKS